MTQLIVSINDNSMLSEIKHAIGMFRGVVSVTERENTYTPNETTLKAMNEVECHDTIVCESFSDYLKLVSDDIQD